MSKYVDLDKVIDKLEDEWGYEGIREDLYEFPPADVVEVVRCRDCKHLAGWDESHPHDFIYKCDRRIIENKVLLDDFCSYGERKSR